LPPNALGPLLSLYALASALYLAYLVTPKEALARIARAVFLLGLGVHTIDIGLRCLRGTHPVASTPEVISFSAWLLCAGYLGLSLRYSLAVVGGFVAPAALVLEVLARLTPPGTSAYAAGPPALGTLGRIHITLSTAGVALFALAAAVAAIYLVSESRLKQKKFGILYHRGPPLATLDAIGHRCITFGFPLFTIAIVTGAIWVARLPRFGASGALRPEYSISMVTWLAFASLLVARTTAGWQGRRAAWLTLFGFGGALTVVLLYLLRYAAGA
jgi:ABC-type uncharacterized transport system permease subunit